MGRGPSYLVEVAATGFVGTADATGKYPSQCLRSITLEPAVAVVLRDGGAGGAILERLGGAATVEVTHREYHSGLEFNTDLHVTIGAGPGVGAVMLEFDGKQPV